VGDGWLVSSVTPAEIQEGRDIVFSTAAEFGREIEEDHIGVLLGYYVADDTEEAVATSYDYITRHRPDAHFTEYSAVGTTEQVSQTIQSYIDAGAQKFVVRPLCSSEETIGQLEIMGTKILPQFVK
jgi:alkanesulfonate monooxygenase SsuD/methylene tetrahydromethanopterin reductase-like flavin-dependent oxidoreductase (luciferase family)